MSTGSELYDLLAKTNATLNPNNTITLRFNDGSSYTTGVIKDGPELSPADKAMEEAKEASTISQAAMEEANRAAVAAGNAEQSASEAAASATNAENFASAAQQSASTASTAATNAETSASNAATSAGNAATSAQAAATSADAAESEAQRAASEANEAKTQASEAKTQASAANSYAVGALNNLSTTQDIMGVLNWVEESIKYVWDYPPTVEDKEYDPSKQYYTVIGKRVIDPIETDYDKYYVLNSESEPASKTGNIVTFDSDLDNFPLKSLTATINPKQSGSGDPAPDNVRPISGWDEVNVTRSGKNLLPPYATTQTKNGITFTVNGDGTITANGTATADTLFLLNADIRSDIATGTSIIVNGCPSSGSRSTYRMYCSNVGYDYGSGVTGNVPSTVCACGIAIFNGYTANNLVFKPMIRLASDSDPTYEPYQANTYTTTLPETVYGGSLDVVNGVLTIDRAMVTFDGSSDEGWYLLNTSLRRTFRIHLSEQYPASALSKTVANGIKVDASSEGTSAKQNEITCRPASYSSTYFYVFVPLDFEGIETAENFNTWLAQHPLTVVYPLAEPRTIQLTPKQVTTLLGTNNVWADSGDATVEYWDGPVGYVTPTSSFDSTETYYTVKGSPVKIDESKQEDHGKGLYYVHDLTNAKEAMADFIKARLALTDKGLYVVGGDTENEGYKILLASDGMTVYDAQGVAVSKFGENIEFSSTRAQYIGGETAYIVFNPEDGTINAGGEGFRFNNNMMLSDMLAEVGKIGGEDGLEQSTEDLLQKTKSISYENGKLIISGGENSNMKLVMESDRIGFYDGDNEVAYISNNQMCIPRSIVLDSLDMGGNKWRWTLNTDDHLTLQWIGG